MDTYEAAIQKIHEAISIKKQDRELYSKTFDLVRNTILNKMREQNKVFKHIYNGPSLFGSYLENMKIEKPDEFDVHFVLKLPYYEKLIVKRDPSRPGFINLDLTHVISHTKNDPNLNFIYPTLNDLVESDNILSRYKLQKWIEEIMINVMDSLPKTGISHSTVKYSKCATAHTIKVTPGHCPISMSIDFVPAFKFLKSELLVLDRPFPPEVKEKLWFAVPKPMIWMGDRDTRSVTFSVCAPQIEKHMLNGKNNLKPAIRLIKSMRDKITARQMKSYFIKTIFLHESEKRDDRFWNQPLGDLLIQMTFVILDYLHNEEIPFYWAPEQNLIESMKKHEIEDIRNEFGRINIILQRIKKNGHVSYNEIAALFDLTSDNITYKA